MEILPDVYDLETVEQLRTLADPLRLRIVKEIAYLPMTVTQIGEAIGVPANKAHYHVRELERVGLAKIVETREKSGILEKYYQTVARDFGVPKQLLQQASPDESIAAAEELLQSATGGFLRAFSRIVRTKSWSDAIIAVDATSLWATQAEFTEVQARIAELLKPYQAPHSQADRVQISFLMLANSAAGQAAETEQDTDRAEVNEVGPGGVGAGSKGLIVETSSGRAGSKLHRVIAAGVLHYTSADLQRILDAGQRLDLNFLGYLHFSPDISPELADRVIFRIRHRGPLTASTSIKAVLRRKGARVQD